MKLMLLPLTLTSTSTTFRINLIVICHIPLFFDCKRYDVIWLDIEHTDGKRYFTWDNGAFPNPVAMQDSIAAKGRKMVVIIDPHIKRDGGYHIHSEAQAKGLYVKDNNNNDFDGWCWPGSSSYLDFTEPAVRSWWADRFALNDYKGSTKNVYPCEWLRVFF